MLVSLSQRPLILLERHIPLLVWMVSLLFSTTFTFHICAIIYLFFPFFEIDSMGFMVLCGIIPFLLSLTVTMTFELVRCEIILSFLLHLLRASLFLS